MFTSQGFNARNSHKILTNKQYNHKSKHLARSSTGSIDLNVYKLSRIDSMDGNTIKEALEKEKKLRTTILDYKKVVQDLDIEQERAAIDFDYRIALIVNDVSNSRIDKFSTRNSLNLSKVNAEMSETFEEIEQLGDQNNHNSGDS